MRCVHSCCSSPASDMWPAQTPGLVPHSFPLPGVPPSCELLLSWGFFEHKPYVSAQPCDKRSLLQTLRLVSVTGLLKATGRDGQARHCERLDLFMPGTGLCSLPSGHNSGRETTVGARLGGCLGKLAHLPRRLQALTAHQCWLRDSEVVPAHREPACSVTESQGSRHQNSRSLFRGHKTTESWALEYVVAGPGVRTGPACSPPTAPPPTRSACPRPCDSDSTLHTSPCACWASQASDHSHVGSMIHDCAVQACCPPLSSASQQPASRGHSSVFPTARPLACHLP